MTKLEDFGLTLIWITLAAMIAGVSLMALDKSLGFIIPLCICMFVVWTNTFRIFRLFKEALANSKEEPKDE